MLYQNFGTWNHSDSNGKVIGPNIWGNSSIAG